jgi:hypothetical protein
VTAAIERAARQKRHSTHLFDPDQLHVTISSACRTQEEPYGEALRVGSAGSPHDLPVHFGQFLADLADLTRELLAGEIVLRFSRVRVDSRGYINLEPGRTHDDALTATMGAYLDRILAKVAHYAATYPQDNWNALLKDQRQPRFGPKKNSFAPHVTLGMIFRQDEALPAPLAGEEYQIDLPSAVDCPLEDVSIVHYAYRSLLRVLGEFEISPNARSKADGDRVLRKLGVAF